MAFAWLEQPRDLQPYIGGLRYEHVPPLPYTPRHRRGRLGTYLRRLGAFLAVWDPPVGGRRRAEVD